MEVWLKLLYQKNVHGWVIMDNIKRKFKVYCHEDDRIYDVCKIDMVRQTVFVIRTAFNAKTPTEIKAFDLMQYSSYQDKKGNEIYSGHIVNHFRWDNINHKEQFKGERFIVLQNGCFGFFDEYKNFRAIKDLWNPGETLEIVGNLYQKKHTVNKFIMPRLRRTNT